MSASYRDNNKRRLQLLATLFFFALAIPSLVLVINAGSQLKWEAFFQYRSLAEELSTRINNEVELLIAREEARSVVDYGFLTVVGDPNTSFLQRSELSFLPAESSVPGLLGYFELDNNGLMSTPLLPEQTEQAQDYGISSSELVERQVLEASLFNILSENSLVAVGAKPKSLLPSQEEPRRRMVSGNLGSSAEDGGLADTPHLASAPVAPAEGQFLDEAPLKKAVPVDADKEEEVAIAEAVMYEAESDVMVSGRMDAPEAVDELKASTAARESFEKTLEKSDADQAEPVEPSQAAFDRLQSKDYFEQQQQNIQSSGKYAKLEDLKLERNYSEEEEIVKPENQQEKENIASVEDQRLATKQLADKGVSRSKRKEQSVLPVTAQLPAAASVDDLGSFNTASRQREVAIRIFESEIDPFEFSLLESGHFVLYRTVWRNGERFIQGAILDREALLQGVIEDAFRGTTLSAMSDLIVAYQDSVLKIFHGSTPRLYPGSSREEMSGEILYQTSLPNPLSQFQLIYSINQLPAGKGATVIYWSAGVLLLVLCVGTFMMYRSGVKQLTLANQQQDFVSSVSHELKTPLTSIRMYGEILREGWASDEQKKQYYDYIYEESERLSRLIANVLQLARMNRNELQVELKPVSVGELLDNVRSKIASQVETAGFDLTINADETCKVQKLPIDHDFFIQILINLVDNAIKFSEKSGQKKIDITAAHQSDGQVMFSIRDYGPGIEKPHMKKIFNLFYRSGNELTRETTGTGIGLALVSQLTKAMNGKVDVVNAKPGAEFRVMFPATD